MVFLLEYVLHAYNMLTDNNISSIKLHNQVANLNRVSSSKTRKNNRIIQLLTHCFEMNWLKNVHATIESIIRNDVEFKLNLLKLYIFSLMI